jgi:hypothetical protein
MLNSGLAVAEYLIVIIFIAIITIMFITTKVL